MQCVLAPLFIGQYNRSGDRPPAARGAAPHAVGGLRTRAAGRHQVTDNVTGLYLPRPVMGRGGRNSSITRPSKYNIFSSSLFDKVRIQGV